MTARRPGVRPPITRAKIAEAWEQSCHHALQAAAIVGCSPEWFSKLLVRFGLRERGRVQAENCSNEEIKERIRDNARLFTEFIELIPKGNVRGSYVYHIEFMTSREITAAEAAEMVAVKRIEISGRGHASLETLAGDNLKY